MPGGRPSIYSPELAEEFCRRLTEGQSLRAVCAQDDMPVWGSVWRWLKTKPEFAAQYAQAREAQAHVVAQQAVDEALTASDPQLGRLAFDARKWFAGKIAPKVYGDKTLNEHTGADGGPIQVVTGVPRAAD